MNTIKFNDTSFEVESYNKNTSFMGETISSSASCTINTNNIESLNALAQDSITSIQILHNNDLIYNLADIDAKIDNISEYLNGDRMGVSVNLTFNV